MGTVVIVYMSADLASRFSTRHLPSRRRRSGTLFGPAPWALMLALALATARAQEPPTPSYATPAEQRLASERLLEQAALQAKLDELDAANASYLEAIELIRAADGEFAGALIGAYEGLAGVLARRGDFPEAVGVLEQALHVSHRNFGLFNLEQAEVLDDLSRVYEESGDTRQAQAMQREILSVALRHFGGESAGVIPYHYRLADYYELARMRGLAREQYETVLEILDADPQAQPAEALKPLRELLRIDTIVGEQTGAQRRLLETLAATPGAKPPERAAALAVLGDAELAGGGEEEALRYYREAYDELVRHDASAAGAFFAKPQMINFVPPPAPVDWGRRADRPYAWGSITARFTLTAGGRAEGIEIVDADPPGLMDERYARRLAEAVYRPRLVGGDPVPTTGLRYSHAFRYFVAEPE